MNKMKLALMAGVAIIGSSAVTESARADFLYAGGSTLASKVYRQLFDCWGYQLPGSGSTPTLPINTACGNLTGNIYGYGLPIFYAPVGSGAGKRALTNHDGSSNSTGLGTVSTSNTIPYTNPIATQGYGYPAFHFAGSDDVITATDVKNYAGLGTASSHTGTDFHAAAGNLIQVPSFAAPVAIMFNGTDGAGNALTPGNPIPAGGSSGLNLSRQALCGIFSGHITQWNNPILTALNPGLSTATGNITVVHRSDGSGTTFLLTNALVAQCNGVTGPNSETDSSPVLYSFPFTDDNITVTCNTAPVPNAIPIRGSNKINWPDVTGNAAGTGKDQCGVAVPNPGNGIFANGNGSAGVTAQVSTISGAIGYVSPDFVQPVVTVSGTPKTANIQSQYDLDNNTGTFEPPTGPGAAAAMNESSAYFGDPGAANPYALIDADITNPLSWSTQGIVPNPVYKGSYPISGFTWLDLYQCYNVAERQEIFSYLQFHYTDTRAAAIIASQGFAPIPANWFGALASILTASSSTLQDINTGYCGGKSGF